MKADIFKSPRFWFLTIAVLVAALSRLLPHPPNVTPVAAMALFGGAYFSNKQYAFIIPLLALLISDIGLELTTGLGFHAMMPIVYIAFIAIAGIGMLLRKRVKVHNIILASLAGSVTFFLLSNFGSWLVMYPKTWSGLVACYTAAVPFFRYTLVGDLVYCGVLFGAFELVRYQFPHLIRVKS